MPLLKYVLQFFGVVFFVFVWSKKKTLFQCVDVFSGQ